MLCFHAFSEDVVFSLTVTKASAFWVRFTGFRCVISVMVFSL